MGVSVGDSGSSGKRSLSADVNLVPFIDLLSVCICFLLMTAVWVQLGILEVKQTYGTAAAADAAQLELEIQFVSEKSLSLVFKKNGKVEKKQALSSESAEALPKDFSNQLGPILEKLGTPKSAIINTRRGVSHGEVVAVMDVLRQNRIVNMGMTVAPLEI